MKKLMVTVIVLAAAAVAISAQHEEAVVPAKISADSMTGKIFGAENMIRTEHDSGNVTLDVTTLLSSDKKFASGMYQSGKSYFEATDPYGVDEFMYFITGSVTLTSSDPEAYLEFLYPTRESWAAGDREFTCLVSTDGVDQFVGSVLTP